MYFNTYLGDDGSRSERNAPLITRSMTRRVRWGTSAPLTRSMTRRVRWGTSAE